MSEPQPFRTVRLKDRADLMEMPGFSDLVPDSLGQPCVWLNDYNCDDDGVRWDDQWSCMCDDECPECGDSISPMSSEWVGPLDRLSRALWESLPEKGAIPQFRRPIEIIEDDQGIRPADGWVVIGIDAPEIRRCGDWPDFDAFMRAKVRDLDEEAVVYLVDGGEPGSEEVMLRAAKIVGSRPVTGTIRAVVTTRSELAAFCDEWQARNIPSETETEETPSPGL